MLRWRNRQTVGECRNTYHIHVIEKALPSSSVLQRGPEISDKSQDHCCIALPEENGGLGVGDSCRGSMGWLRRVSFVALRLLVTSRMSPTVRPEGTGASSTHPDDQGSIDQCE